MTSRIASVTGRQIWDSRGRPTVEAEVVLESGAVGRAIAPAGASRGAHEAIDLRDGGRAFGGFGVNRAVAGIGSEIAGAICGMDAREQVAIDAALCALDGTLNKARLGANAVVSVSMAVLQAAAADAREPLWRYLADGRAVRIPLPEIQIFGGGAHAGRRTDVQDFMIMCPNAGGFRRSLEITDDVYRAAGKLMEAKGPPSGVADEGGWWPNFASNEDALDTLTKAIEASGHRAGEDVFISLDIAANELGDAGVCNAALIKVNQVGTVTEAKAALDAAVARGWGAIVSARSGESEDVTIAHLATGWNAGQLKVGSFTRSERMAKWNEMLRIEEAMGSDAVFAGFSAFAGSIGAVHA